MPTVLRRTRLIQGFGAVACAAALACALLSARGAMTGWLAAAVVLQSVPLAGLMLLASMRLVAGEWGLALHSVAEAAARLWPLAALAFVPVLLGLEVIYDWGRDSVSGALDTGWLGYVQYGVRTTIRFMVFAIVARSQIGRQASPVASAVGLGVLVVGTSVTALDWLMSLDTGYHSSIFPLQVLSIEVTSGYLVLLIAGLLRHPAPERVDRLGALLLTLQLVWAYLQLLPALMLATDELPGPAAWYAARLHGPWQAMMASAVVLGVGPILALLSSRVRTRRGPLLAVAIVALTGKVIELAWLTLPGRGNVAVLAYALALVGFACVIAVRLKPSDAAVTT